MGDRGGITLMVLGTLAVIYDTTATIASVVVFGWLLRLAGVMQFVHAFQVTDWKAFFLYLLDAIVRTVAGVLLVIYPGSGAATLTLILSFYFIAGGSFRAIGSTVVRFPAGAGRRVRSDLGRARRDARAAVADLRPVVHWFRCRHRHDLLGLGAADVRLVRQEAGECVIP